MGGSGGGGSYMSANDIAILRAQAKERLDQSRIDSEVNSFLQQKLVNINARDVEGINGHLEQMENMLADQVEPFDRLLFGGSVEKHTYVDGLSDVDSLVVLKDERLLDKSPEEVRTEFAEMIRRKLPQGEIADIRVGRLAITIVYTDGAEIQLLPAVERGNDTFISSYEGNGWSRIRPREFAHTLTESNRNQGGAVVPTIKLAKAILANKLGEQSLSGYHVESLAVEAFSNYEGSRSPKAMLTHFFEYSSERVLRPISDASGQSIHVDDSMGEPGSEARQRASRFLRSTAQTMSQTQSMGDWQNLLQ